MKALVSGGNGFLGRHVVAALRESGAGVRVLDVASREAAAGVEQVTADLLTSEGLERAFDGVDVLVHLAAALRGRPEEILRNTVDGTRRLLEAMGRSATRRLVLASSLSVYDWSRLGSSVLEDAPTLDRSSLQKGDAYAQAKAQQEQLARRLAQERGWTLTVLRPAALWGSGVDAAFLLGPRVGPLQAVVAPSAPVRLLYVENAADAFARAARRDDGGERIVNLIDDAQLTNWHYAGLVQRRAGGLRVPVPYGAGLLAACLASRLLGAIELPYFLQPARFAALHKPVAVSRERARDALGWTPRFGFAEARSRAESAHV
jgi:UDP-glucose 4-epimerase